MANEAPLLELVGVTKRFEAPDGAGSLLVLHDISLVVRSGESMAILGPSGSGKSTLLQIMGTLDQPSAGRVLLAGTDLGTLDEPRLAEVRNRQIGFVFQAHYLLPQCTVLENVLVPTLAAKRKPGGAADEETLSRATHLLERLGLGERLKHRPGQLSGGEKQRVAVARALINRPQLLLADEPTGSLDQESAHGLGKLLRELNREEGVTLILVTHSPDLAKETDRQLVLINGCVVPQPD
ncbi:MAG TPA: ABC transporter ATP-binding protein [Clostridia bacterium]|nr:ABC transporter ATP-binding protein [Clostridia bacterium]